MNDPGVDASVDKVAKKHEDNAYDAQKREEEEEEDFLDPSRWWFASTACPLIAGTFGPIANSFSICALVQSWREYIPDGGTEAHGTHIADPSWLLGINSVSLILALVANFALLLNMTRRISFAIAQSITIVGWLLASFLLIALVAVASTSVFRLAPPQNHALTQAYYYAIIAAALYFIISLVMIVTVYGAYKGHYEKEFRLTVSQRTLMLQTIMFMVYLLIGALIFSKIEGWEYLDAVYWADFTLLTVGIGGDFVPVTHLGRSLLFPFAIGGIVTLGLVVGSVRTLVLERGKHKMEARMTEKTREQVLKSVNEEKQTLKIGLFHKVKLPDGLPGDEHRRRAREFYIMRKIQAMAQTRRRWMSFGTSFLAAMLLWLLGAYVFMKAEHGQQWSYFVSLYFAYTSLLTIGYGDLQPEGNAGKPFFVFWSLLAVPTLTILISNMGDTVVKTFSDLTIWAGSITILPSEQGFRASMKATAANVKNRRLRQHKEDFGFQAPPGILPQGDREENHQSDVEHLALDRMSRYVEADELTAAQEADAQHDTEERDIHFYHYVLTKEIRSLMQDLSASPPKKYTYHDWTYYLKLIGEDEGNPDLHRKPPVLPKKDGMNFGNRNKLYKMQSEKKDDEPYAWSWIGTRSPLMGNKSEAEWLLENLSSCLEGELKRMRSSTTEERRKPPISMDALIRMGLEKDKKNDEGDDDDSEAGSKKNA